jgi:PAS domain S-box-containing protein
MEENEEDLLRSAALKNANSILLARQRAEEALYKQSEWLRITLASIGDAVISTDAAGRVTFLNGVAEALTGWSQAEALECPLPNVFHIINEQTRQPAENPALCALREGIIVRLANHTLLVAKDGVERAIDDSAAPIRDRQGNVVGCVLIFRDISERRKVEEERKRAEKDLREADRRKNEFLAMLAHELRNPLAPIRNSLQLLRFVCPNPPDQVGHAYDIIERQLEHLVRLVDDLLDVSRITSGKIQLQKERVDLAAVVARAVESAQPLIDARRHTLEIKLPADRLTVAADPVRLAQVLWNLLNNAAKYTPAGGRIWLTAVKEQNEAVLRVGDTGLGIPPEMLPRVFDLFTQMERTLARAEGGLGIGLTLVRRLTEMHGGTVQAFSGGPGRGSEFIVRLPVADQVAAREPTAPSGAAQRAGPASGKRILVVDDNQDAAQSLAMLLRLYGNDVRTAHDGRLALEVAAAYRPDVVLLDIGLPGLDGLEVCRRLRRQLKENQPLIVAMTGYGQEEDRRRSEEAGFDAHMVKPADLQALQDLLSRPELVRRDPD